MSDIRYKWNDGLNSVQVSGDVSLPQFKVITQPPLPLIGIGFPEKQSPERKMRCFLEFSFFSFWSKVVLLWMAWNDMGHFEYNKFWFLAVLISVRPVLKWSNLIYTQVEFWFKVISWSWLTTRREKWKEKLLSPSFTQFPSILPNLGKLPRNAAALILPFAAMLQL